MTDTARRLLTDALQLAEADRAELAASLINSLDETADEDVDAAWEVEIQHRLEEIHRGEVGLLSFDEVRDRLFGKTSWPGGNLDSIRKPLPKRRPHASGTRPVAIRRV
jgi:putative addiction module component (TIGR02574 family)